MDTGHCRLRVEHDAPSGRLKAALSVQQSPAAGLMGASISPIRRAIVASMRNSSANSGVPSQAVPPAGTQQ